MLSMWSAMVQMALIRYSCPNQNKGIISENTLWHTFWSKILLSVEKWEKTTWGRGRKFDHNSITARARDLILAFLDSALNSTQKMTPFSAAFNVEARAGANDHQFAAAK